MGIIDKCKKITQTKMDKILAIPDHVNRIEEMLLELEKSYDEIQGELIFEVGAYEGRKATTVVWIEVVVSLTHHHPTVLRFQKIGRTIYVMPLLEWEENLSMSCDDCRPKIKELFKKRIEELI